MDFQNKIPLAFFHADLSIWAAIVMVLYVEISFVRLLYFCKNKSFQIQS